MSCTWACGSRGQRHAATTAFRFFDRGDGNEFVAFARRRKTRSAVTTGDDRPNGTGAFQARFFVAPNCAAEWGRPLRRCHLDSGSQPVMVGGGVGERFASWRYSGVSGRKPTRTRGQRWTEFCDYVCDAAEFISLWERLGEGRSLAVFICLVSARDVLVASCVESNPRGSARARITVGFSPPMHS